MPGLAGSVHVWEDGTVPYSLCVGVGLRAKGFRHSRAHHALCALPQMPMPRVSIAAEKGPPYSPTGDLEHA